MYLFGAIRRCNLGLAKNKMFGVKNQSKIQKFVDRGVLLPIDIAYAEMMEPQKRLSKLALHAALLLAAREGHLCLEKKIISDSELASLIPEGRFYLPKYAEIEDTIVSEIKRLLSYPPKDIPDSTYPSATEEQREAIFKALKYPISLLIGGPGTGKTHTAAQIAACYSSKVIITAPTGKAASHLASKIFSEVPACTLHSLLLEEDEIDAGLVIVDESSMIDPFLFARLLASIGEGTHLVLMGDNNQLPAVEGGSVFSDLIATEKIPTTQLTKCMRSDRKEILQLAENILLGTAEIKPNINLGFSNNELPKIYESLWQFVKEKDFNHFRILSTLRKGPLGVDSLNQFLFEKFSSKNERIPILITRNDKQAGLSNGDTGFLEKDLAIFGEKQFNICQLPQFEYAYCISVHKSQGSEYEEVLLLVPDGSESFGKEVLYTGVTRAKSALFIDGNLKQIAIALQKHSEKISGIRDKMKEL